MRRWGVRGEGGLCRVQMNSEQMSLKSFALQLFDMSALVSVGTRIMTPMRRLNDEPTPV